MDFSVRFNIYHFDLFKQILQPHLIFISLFVPWKSAAVCATMIWKFHININQYTRGSEQNMDSTVSVCHLMF